MGEFCKGRAGVWFSRARISSSKMPAYLQMRWYCDVGELRHLIKAIKRTFVSAKRLRWRDVI